MGKYDSFHFSPLNNRSMLMPKGEKGKLKKSPPLAKGNNSFSPVPEEWLNKEEPYFQLNLGFHERQAKLGEKTRPYGVYVPAGMSSKGAAILLFPPDGMAAGEFLAQGNWKALSDRYHVALVILESESWDKEDLTAEFDYAQAVVDGEYSKRSTVDICESFIYPIGLGEGAYVAAAFALTYSATFPAFAADGDCAVDPELLEVLRGLPSDGIDTLKKTDIALPGFLIDRSGKAQVAETYLKETIRAKEEGLTNRYGRVYLQQPRPGAYYVNDQPIAQVWLGDEEKVKGVSREELNEAMVEFVLRFSRWGGFGNNHLRPKRSPETTGVRRVEKVIDGLKRYWDVYVPSCYRPDDGKVYPLVVAIHGTSCNSEYFAETSDWHRLAEERGFFVCYASGYPRNVGRLPFPLPSWCVWPMDVEGIDESVYFTCLLDDMEATYHIDKKRIYAVGHSNGGRMTQRLMRTMPERFAAFGPTGAIGGPTPEEIEPISDRLQVPVWYMVGEHDMMDSTLAEGTAARATLLAMCRANRMEPDFENWYDNGNYHTLVMYDRKHAPMVKFTVMKGCPHTYTAEMAQLTWDDFLCHFVREPDGTITYQG